MTAPESHATPQEGKATADAVPAPRFARLRRVIPWFSLAVGVTGAVLMDRGPRRATLVALVGLLVWLLLGMLQWLARIERGTSEPGRIRRRLLSAARLSSLALTQSAIQLDLFFAVPFYIGAANLGDPGHLAFLAVLLGLCAVALWDPWSAHWLHVPALSTVLTAAASFAALNVVLPGLGLSTQASLWTAAGCTVLAAPPLIASGVAPERRRRVALQALAVALLLPCLLWLGAARVVPAAPLRLVRAEIGVRQRGKWIEAPVHRLEHAPDRLICATAIASPLGLRDRLFHVWKKDRELRARVPLQIAGGREQGYRTQSRISHFGSHPAGTYTCSVVTASGQVLGTRAVVIER